jgi:DNA-binding NarL/FixJ family response regulator
MSFMTIAALTLAALLLPLVILLWATESRDQRIRRWRRAGASQQCIADRLNVSRSTVRRVLARA